jgi:hypothetical protein
MKTTKKPSRASRSAAPPCSAFPFPRIGVFAWFTKSMRMVEVVEDYGDGKWGVETLDTRKRMTATTDSLAELKPNNRLHGREGSAAE